MLAFQQLAKEAVVLFVEIRSCSGDPHKAATTDPNIYRPICLVSAVSEIFESIIAEKKLIRHEK